MTVADAGSTGLRITETDTYVVGQESYRTDVNVTNNGTQPAAFLLYRAGDCYLQDSDTGFGAANAGTGSVACLGGHHGERQRGGRQPDRAVRPLTPGSSYLEAEFNEVWAAIATGQPFPKTCRCDEDIDNGAGLSWSATVPPGGFADVLPPDVVLARRQPAADHDQDG